MAVMVLEEACAEPDHLRTAVNLKPKLDHLGDVGNPLLLRYIHTLLNSCTTFAKKDQISFH
jgi:hypothetical protein